ncbi:hypothetical protein PG993_009853 [Apiospora rasikravindrae]|uniref:Uncharacterized protein n=1 Tax=Apiospora rasikravindrae TaxID=990691 RepID=A0ABR1SKJ9_9PEZI
MNKTPDTRPSPLEGLSVELVRLVLSALPDVASLRATVLSCPLFYRAFLKAEAAIATQVLLNQIDASVLPEAMATAESARLRLHADEGPLDEMAVIGFMERNLRHRPAAPTSWSLLDALRVARLHSAVEGFGVRFANEARSQLNPSRSINVTRQELEPCCQYIDKRVTTAFDDIVDHDVAWGAFNVDYGTLVSPTIQHILLSGLEKLHQIFQAETYEQRHALLHHFRIGGVGPPATELALYSGLRGANEQTHIIFLKWLTPDDDVLRLKQPYFPESDPGPADAWRWAHQEESWAHWVYQENRRDLRRWGYVMWDRPRLESVDVFWQPWDDTYYSINAAREQQVAAQRRAGLHESWERREWIWKHGGCGWWSWDDESKVRYPDAVMEDSRPRPMSEPGGPDTSTTRWPESLQEAKEMLSAMNFSHRQPVGS